MQGEGVTLALTSVRASRAIGRLVVGERKLPISLAHQYRALA
jgi:hypothetical protein